MPDTKIVETRQEYKKRRPRSLPRLLFQKLLMRVARVALLSKIRRFLYRWAGVTIAPRAFIGPYCYIEDNFPELVSIGPGAIVAVGVMLIAHDDSKDLIGEIQIGEKAFIGAGSIILSGITIGTGAVVGAGAVVTKDVAPGETVVGIPAKPVTTK